MFTGLVTDVGQVRSIERAKDEVSDTRIVIDTSYDMSTVDIGASIACAGVCLTVVDKADGWFAADVSDETLSCTSLGDWQVGALVNLERSLKLGDEMGGHIVTGHVDCVGELVVLSEVHGSCKMDISVPISFAHLLVTKGSVCVNGTSLTVNNVEDQKDHTILSINLIPHTQEVTSFKDAKVGQLVNIEFDILARYVARIQDITL